MAKKNSGLIWFLIVFFFGWFGLDKFLNGAIMWGLVKLVLSLIGIGVIINLIEAILVLLGKYKVPLTAYFK